MQNTITLKERYLKFVKTISDSEIVYGLKNKKGFATSSSTQYVEEDGSPIGVLCFWSEKARAKSCAKEEWKKYKTVEIPLPEFIENWCIGMANDGLLTGIQFDQNLFGYEAEPLELLLDITTELRLLGKDLSLRKFKGIDDIENQVKEAIK